MSTPATPTKRVLTEDAHSTFNSPRSPYNNFLSDDLSTRLQNLGSRVRKNVNEGYSTQRFGGIPSTIAMTSSSESSPVKSSGASGPSQSSPIFRSANDTLQDVFSSPTRAVDIIRSLSNSPRKRGYAEVDLQEENEERLPIATSNARDGVSGFKGMEAASDDEEIMIITDASPDNSPNRPIRPLRKTVHRPPAPPFNTSLCTANSCLSCSHTGASTDNACATTKWKNLSNHPF